MDNVNVYFWEQAHRILGRQPRGQSAFVFPSPCKLGHPRNCKFPMWKSIRRNAGIEDLRLHDLHHTFASHAVANGIPVPVVSRLLGHSNVRMTMRYANLADKETEAAAERIGTAMAGIMAIGPQPRAPWD